MPELRLITVLTTKLKKKFPLPVITYFGTSAVECLLDNECISILNTLKSFVHRTEFGSLIIEKLLSLAADILKLIDVADVHIDTFTNLVLMIDILADFLFFRWYHKQQKQSCILPFPTNTIHPLAANLPESILGWLRRCLSLQLNNNHLTTTLNLSYFPMDMTNLSTDSNILTNRAFMTIDLSTSLFKSVGRVCFILSASNWSAYTHEILYHLFADPSSAADTPDHQPPTSNTSNPTLGVAAGLTTTMFLAQWGMFTTAHLRSYIYDFAHALKSMRKERRLALYQITHHILWSWIELHTRDFHSLMACSPDDDSDMFVRELDHLFECIVVREVDVKKKVLVWPLLFLVTILIRDKAKPCGSKFAKVISSAKNLQEKRVVFVELVLKSIKRFDKGDKLETVPIVMLDLLKTHQLLTGSPAQGHLSVLVHDTGMACKVMAREIGHAHANHSLVAVPQAVVIDFISLVVFQQGAVQILDSWRDACCVNEMSGLSLICLALVRSKHFPLAPKPLAMPSELLKSIQQYLNPYILAFINEHEDCNSDSQSSSSRKSKHGSDWKPWNLPFMDILHALETHLSLVEDPVVVEFLYQVMLRCVRPIQHKAAQIMLALTSMCTNPEILTAITNVLINLERVIIRSEVTSLQVHGVHLFTDLFQVPPLDNSPTTCELAHDPRPLNWPAIHAHLEAMILICLVSPNRDLVRGALQCLGAVLEWNLGPALFSNARNRLIYTLWHNDLDFNRFLLDLTRLDPTPCIQAAVECAIEMVSKDCDVDRIRIISFIFAAGCDPDVVTRAFRAGDLADVPPSAYTYIHPSNLTCAFLTIPENIPLYNDADLHSVMVSMSAHDLAHVSVNLSAVISSLLPRTADSNAHVFCTFVVKLFDRCWWDTACVDGLLDRLVHWLGNPELMPACMSVLERICRVTRFYFPTTSTGRQTLQQLLPYVFSSDALSVLALRFDHMADFLVAYSRLKQPGQWICSVFDKVGGDKVPSVADLVCSDIVCALNSVVPATELDEISAVVYHLAVSQDRIVDVIQWLTRVELDNTSQPHTFLRSTVFAVKLASFAVKDAGEGLIVAAQTPLMRVPDELIELDSGKDTGGFARLEALCESVMLSVLGSSHTVGQRLRTILKNVADLMETKFPAYRLVGVGNLVFLRFICPSLMSMQVPLNLRARTLVAKVIQNTVNGVYFGGKEEHMAPMNKFVAKYIPLVLPFLEELCQVPGSAGAEVPSVMASLSIPRGHHHSPSGSMASWGSLSRRPLNNEPADVKFLNIVTRYKDQLLTCMLPSQRNAFVRVVNGILPLRTYSPPQVDLAGLPEPLAISDDVRETLVPCVRWFVRAGVSRANHLPVFTLTLQNVPLHISTQSLLASMYFKLRHTPSVPVVLVVDASFSVSSSTISELIGQFISVCCSIIDKVVVLFCSEKILSVIDSLAASPTVVLAGKLEAFQEHVPVDVLLSSRQTLLADLVGKPAHLTTMPVGQLQLPGAHVIFSYPSHGKTVHELYHVSELVAVRTPAATTHGALFCPGTNRFLIFRLNSPSRPATSSSNTALEMGFLDLVSIIIKRQVATVPEMETCRPLRTEDCTMEHPARRMFQVRTRPVPELHKVTSSMGDRSWRFITQELCAHMILASDLQEKLMCADRFCEWIVPSTPISVWGRPLVNVLLCLNVSDRAVAEVVHRLLASSPQALAILKFMLDLNDAGRGVEFNQLLEGVVSHHVRLMDSHQDYAHEHITFILRNLLREVSPSVRMFSHYARSLSTLLLAHPSILGALKPHILWTLYVLSKISDIPEATRTSLSQCLWHERPSREWTSFPLESRVAVLEISQEHLKFDSAVFVPSLQLFVDIKSVESSSTAYVIDGQLFDVPLQVLCDRASVGINDDLAFEILDLIETVGRMIKYIDADTVRADGTRVIPQLVALGLALLGIYGSDSELGGTASASMDRLTQSAVQLTVLALEAMDAHGLLIEKTLEQLMHGEVPVMMETFERLFGVSTRTCFSVAVGLILCRVKLVHRIHMEPLIRVLINLSQNVPGTSPFPDDSSYSKTHTGYLFPILGSRALATKLLPRSQDPRVVLYQLQLSLPTLVLLTAHLLQVLDEASVLELDDTVQWVVEWISAVYAESATIIALILDPFAECVEQLVAAGSNRALLSSQPSRPLRHYSSNNLGEGAHSAHGGLSVPNMLRPRSSTTAFMGEEKESVGGAVQHEATWKACDLLSKMLGDEVLVSRARSLREDKGGPAFQVNGTLKRGKQGVVDVGLPSSLGLVSLSRVLESMKFTCLMPKDKRVPEPRQQPSRGQMLAAVMSASEVQSPTTPKNHAAPAIQVDRPRGVVPP